MTKVVIDTNVVVSAGISQDGNPAFIFGMLILGIIQNYTTNEILDEISEVLRRPRIAKRITQRQQDFLLETFEELSEKIVPTATVQAVREDPDDDKFLECAVSASAEYIISGDGHLLNLGEFRGIKIVSPAKFVSIMQQKGKHY